jgi:ribosomal protein S18 acetylase RimI-like enzyme
MNNFNFLQKYQGLQHTIMYDELIDLGFAVIGYSKTDPYAFWNLALTNVGLSENQILKIEDVLRQRQRDSTIYFENKNQLKEFKVVLEKNGYKENFEDCWQFWDSGKEPDSRYFNSVKKVTDIASLKIFLEAFNRCYQKNDPQNPYGELGSDYLRVSEDVWRRHSQSYRVEYFMIYKNNQPVAVSTLTNHDGIGYISNVGSLREVRGEGYGKAATLFCVQESIKHDNREHCLATEEGAYPNEFYKRIGFVSRFTAIGYTKILK